MTDKAEKDNHNIYGIYASMILAQQSRDHAVKEMEKIIAGRSVALVHDFLLSPGGAEKVLETFGMLFPRAPIYTLLHDPDGMKGKFAGRDIRPSFLQTMPRMLRRRHRLFLPLLPTAPETFDLRDYDIVISSSGAWSKGIVTRLDTLHVAYIHSPMRFVWDYNERYAREARGKEPSIFLRAILSYVRVWDRQAADRPDVLIANSRYTQQRIAKYYRRQSVVLHPPITGIAENDVPSQEGKYFLVVSRLSSYKNVALAIDVCNKLGLPLVVVGEGRECATLRRRAGKTVRMVGWQDDESLVRFYAGARAVLFPVEDDFGMVAAEALAHGVPVVALRRGGVTEIIQEGVTGEFFDAPVAEVCADALRRFLEKEGAYDRAAMRAAAQRFSQEQFISSFGEILSKALSSHTAHTL